MVDNLAWVNGEWGTAKALMLPLKDRGLQLGDGIFETILILNGHPKLLEAHLKRWEKSASLLSMQVPPSFTWINPLIHEAIERAHLNNSNGALRLNWSRGDNKNRGINLALKKCEESDHRFWMELNTTQPDFRSVSAMISQHEQRNANSHLSHCKTFGYGQSIQARHEAMLAGYDEALMLSTNGEICCGATANLLVKRDNKWLTPSLASGCFPGVMRQQAIKIGMVTETRLEPIPQRRDQWLLINSLGCRAISQVNRTVLSVYSNPKALWLSLLND